MIPSSSIETNLLLIGVEHPDQLHHEMDPTRAVLACLHSRLVRNTECHGTSYTNRSYCPRLQLHLMTHMDSI